MKITERWLCAHESDEPDVVAWIRNEGYVDCDRDDILDAMHHAYNPDVSGWGWHSWAWEWLCTRTSSECHLPPDIDIPYGVLSLHLGGSTLTKAPPSYVPDIFFEGGTILCNLSDNVQSMWLGGTTWSRPLPNGLVELHLQGGNITQPIFKRVRLISLGGSVLKQKMPRRLYALHVQGGTVLNRVPNAVEIMQLGRIVWAQRFPRRLKHLHLDGAKVYSPLPRGLITIHMGGGHIDPAIHIPDRVTVFEEGVEL